MTGSYLLDTNIVVALLSGDMKVKDEIASADEVFISVVVLGELYYGVEKSIKVEQNRDQINKFADTVTVLECDEDTATEYGKIKSHLKKAGTLIPENDIWISATGRQFDLTISTRDKHFRHVPDVKLVEW